MDRKSSEMVELKPGRRPTLEQVQYLKVRRASQYEGKTAHFALCVFNLMNAILGSGILGLANAMTNLGYILFTVLLVLVALLAFNSIRLLLDMCDLTGITSYEAIGRQAFGEGGKIVTVLSILTHTLGAMCSFLFIVKYELPEVLRTLTGAEECSSAWYLNGDYIVILVTLVIIMPLSAAKNIGFLGYTSGFAMACMIFFTVVIVIEKFIIPCPIYGMNSTVHHEEYHLIQIPEHIDNYTNTVAMAIASTNNNPTVEPAGVHNESTECVHKSALTQELEEALEQQQCEPEPFVISLKSAYAVPTMVFAFQCHASVLPIYLELTNPTKTRMQLVSIVSITNIFLLYFIASLFGYLTFFTAVGPELLLMYSYYDPDNIVILLARIMVLICVIFSTPLLHFPSRRSIENLFFSKYEFSWIRHLGIMVVLLSLTDILVIYVPTIREVFGFIGATSASMLVIILPSLFYIKLGLDPTCSFKKISCICLVVFGILFTIMSLTLIIFGWLQ
uniref:sodium-coupled neutral amino acid transporter 4-like n=1 Tax=Styela clava TaxID=7725 RepID=UPI0019393B85|nr:sodium-coupled neutral amino acid transporter 4-like [Styela clava]